MKRIAIEVPKDLVTGKDNPGNVISHRIGKFNTKVVEVTLEEALKLKEKYSGLAVIESKKLQTFKKLKVSELEKFIKKIEAYHFNLTIIKEHLANANTPINSAIYTKGTCESLRVTLNKVISNHKDKNQAALKKKAGEIRATIIEETKALTDYMADYNSKVKVTLNLIDV
jgi:hypothetical protein